MKEKKGDSTPNLTQSTSTPVRSNEEDKDDGSTTNKSVQNARQALKDRYKNKSKSSSNNVIETPTEEAPVKEEK